MCTYYIYIYILPYNCTHDEFHKLLPVMRATTIRPRARLKSPSPRRKWRALIVPHVDGFGWIGSRRDSPGRLIWDLNEPLLGQFAFVNKTPFWSSTLSSREQVRDVNLGWVCNMELEQCEPLQQIDTKQGSLPLFSRIRTAGRHHRGCMHIGNP